MADEATDALIPEAPSTDEAAAPTEAPAHDPYEKRYKDLRSDYDRKNTLLDRARQGDVNAIRELGFDVDEPEDPTPEYDEDPYAAKLSEYEKKIAELDQWKQQQEATKIADGIRSHVDHLAQQNNVTLTDADKEYIFGRAVQGDQIGPDSTEAAFKAHLEYRNALLEAERANWLETKQSPRVGTGQAASKEIDFATATDAEIHAHMQARLQGGPTA